MGILDDFIVFWVRGKSIGVPKLSKSSKVMYGVVPSSDNEKIEILINSIIGRICKIDRDDNGISNLGSFLDDIVNREMQIYPLVRDVCNWKYESSIKDNMEYHQFKLVSKDNVYIVIDVKSYKDGDILEFSSMYYRDVSEYLYDRRNNSLGTRFVRIYSVDGINYFLEDKIYGLDLSG